MYTAVSCSVRAEHLYVHVPFCARRCVYCDFSIAVRPTVPVSEYLDAIARELAARHLESVLDLQTLYFGGGTPSKLGGDGIHRLMEIVRTRARLSPDCEVTVEANPEDVTPWAVQQWRDAGVNRVSLGVQSFDDGVLTWMHRTHDAAASRRAIATLADEGIENVSVDLIFAMPDVLQRSWRSDLDAALATGVPHLSVYGLTIEPHTPLGRWVARRVVNESPEEGFEEQFLEAHDALTAAGFEHYEVSNFGRPGFHSRHNWAYWRRKSYAGVGPSAHEFDGTVRRWNASAYADWAAKLGRGEPVTIGAETLEPEQVIAEGVYLTLRTNGGLLLAGEEGEFVDRWSSAGWIEVGSDSRLRLTPSGWLRLDTLAADLTLLRSRY